MDPVQPKALQQVLDRLQERLPEVGVAHLREEVDVVIHQYRDSRIHDFLPILVEREVLEREQRLAASSR